MTESKQKKGIIRSTYDFKAWMGMQGAVDRWSRTYRYFKGNLFGLTRASTSGQTFQQVKQRYGADDQKLQQLRKQFTSYFYVFLGLALAIFYYAIFLVQKLASAQGLFAYIPSFTAFMLGVMVLAYALKFHFWAFLIREQRLDCSAKEWLKNGFF